MGSYYKSRPTFTFGGFTMTPAVKALLVINAVLYVFPALFHFNPYAGLYLALTPVDVLHGMVWQLVTYMFFHASFTHFLFNMLTLWMFGTAVEQTWGTRRFTWYYLACGAFAGLTVVVVNSLLYMLAQSPESLYQAAIGMRSPTIGSSGAIFGLILAFGLLFPDAPILLMFLFPIPAKYFAIIMGFIEFFLMRTQPGGNVSHLAHLGGMLFGLVYIKVYLQRRRKRPAFRPAFRAPVFEDEKQPRLWDNLRDGYRRWKLQRARRKFEVYMRKHQDEGDDRWLQ